MQEIECWKEIDGIPGYKVSSLGRVMGRSGKIIKLQKYKGHGCYWFFRMPHINFTSTIHRLVAKHFIPNPLNLPEVNHKLGNKDDNRASQLEWCTRKYNMQHAHETGLKKNIGSRRIFKDPVVFQIIKDCFKEGYSNVSIAKYFKCHQSTIAYIRQGKRQYYSL